MALGPLNNSNDTPIGGINYRSWVDPIPEPNDGDILIYRALEDAWVNEPTPSVDASSLVRAGYGEVRLSAPQSISNITAVPQKLPADITDISVPVNVIQNLANDSLVVQLDGVWQVNIGFELSFTESNAGRAFDLGLQNITEATLTRATRVGVGRDQAVANYSITFVLEVAAATIGDEFALLVSSATDTFENVFVDAYSFSVVHVSY